MGKKNQGGQAGKKKKQGGGAKANPKPNVQSAKSQKSSAVGSAPAAFAPSIPKTFIESYSVGNGIGFRGIESLGHFIVHQATSAQPGGLVLTKEVSVNPLNPTLFPRVSALARVFEQYAFKKLRFFYVPRSSTADTTSILQYFDYDPADPAATTDLQVLDNMTRDCSVVWQPSSINVDVKEVHRNRMSFFVETTDDATVSSTAARQEYCGVWRVYSQTAQALELATYNHGYLFVEYDLHLLVPRPPREALLTALPKWAGVDGSSTTTLATNSNVLVALPYKQQQVGMIGGPNEGGDISSLLSNAWGSLSNVYDAAKQVYGAGKWLTSAAYSLAAAAFEEKTDVDWDKLSAVSASRQLLLRSLRQPLSGRGFRSEEETWTCIFQKYVPEPSPEVHRKLFARAKVLRGLSPDAAGGFTEAFSVWDLNGNAVPKDWPLTANPAAAGLVDTSLGYSITYTDAGAITPTSSWTWTTPAGKQYVCRFNLVTDAASGSSRVVSDPQFSFSRVGATVV